MLLRAPASKVADRLSSKTLAELFRNMFSVTRNDNLFFPLGRFPTTTQGTAYGHTALIDRVRQRFLGAKDC